MADGKKVGAAKKLAAEVPIAVRGPMLGKKGRLDPCSFAMIPFKMLSNR
jgi:hypothetical protein